MESSSRDPEVTESVEIDSIYEQGPIGFDDDTDNKILDRVWAEDLGWDNEPVPVISPAVIKIMNEYKKS